MKITYAEGLAKAIHESLASDPRVVLIGGSIVGLNMAARKFMEPVVREFSDRIMITPVSELGLAGAGIGAAMCGQRPLVDLGTGSFIYQAFAQVANEAANVHYMSGGQTSAPVTFYCLAGIRGTGAAQHSQRTQAMLGNVPGVQVFVPGGADDAYGLMKWALTQSRDPTVFISHPKLFTETAEIEPGGTMLPVGKARIRRQGADVTIIANSITVPLALAAATLLQQDHRISAEVVDLRTVVPLDRDTVLASVAKTGRAVIADECHRSFGVAAEIAATLAEEGLASLKGVRRVAVPDVPIPFSKALEDELLITSDKIVAAALEVRSR